MRLVLPTIVALMLIFVGPAFAADLKLVKVARDVYAIVGPLTNRGPDNFGNNATFGLVVTDDGAVLIDSGGTRRGAEAIHRVIKSVTDKPLRYVINSGGQDHRWFGNDYFAELGARIISSKAARADHEKRLADQIGRLTALTGDDVFAGTRERYADILFDDVYELELGGVHFHIEHAGQAHTPGDAFIWLADRSVMFTGDIVYVERMLGVGEQSNSKSWVEVFETMAAYQPQHVVPGHGHPVTFETAHKDTYQYLVDLRARVGEFLDDGGDASEISRVDMSDYEYLLNHETLSGRNALKVFTELEWE